MSFRTEGWQNRKVIYSFADYLPGFMRIKFEDDTSAIQLVEYPVYRHLIQEKSSSLTFFGIPTV